MGIPSLNGYQTWGLNEIAEIQWDIYTSGNQWNTLRSSSIASWKILQFADFQGFPQRPCLMTPEGTLW